MNDDFSQERSEAVENASQGVCVGRCLFGWMSSYFYIFFDVGRAVSVATLSSVIPNVRTRNLREIFRAHIQSELPPDGMKPTCTASSERPRCTG